MKGFERKNDGEKKKVLNGFLFLRTIGAGAFSRVYQAINKRTSEQVAIKKVPFEQSSRELNILQSLNHPNIITLKEFYVSKSSSTKKKFLNLVTDLMPTNLEKVIKHFNSQEQAVPAVLIKFYSFQLLSALRYLHNKGICHRDIKPANVLIDTRTHILKLADFGSAKFLDGSPSVSYICSRNYRAPELIFGSRSYSFPVDLWSFGCVLSELFLGQAIFPGESAVDQAVEVMRVLGTPTREQIRELNEDYSEFRFPELKIYPFSKVFDGRIEREALDLIGNLLKYLPRERINANRALKHPFFNRIHDRSLKLPNGEALPEFEEDKIMFEVSN
jgi:glycogen synthase kinase 3 beta